MTQENENLKLHIATRVFTFIEFIKRVGEKR